ncbi:MULTISPECIES: tyrosine-type recombinase/integrase [Nocardiopsis]|uniref:Tyr recombinase domain-containing protein n=1 Tax=Nocardiopsis sinuspersici TaxID=501010 RepID=A0A1V3BVL0_9ACTN|nr:MULTISPECIES: tyrosine-type recombinase/integrase [Nocardiopsis]OOC52412.1 hypothetical protein NOSIN_00005 [Nocardiopsis sinuspersici]
MSHTQQENEPDLPALIQDHPSVQVRDRIQGLHEAAAAKIADAVPENTRRAYATDRADWAAFCASLGIEPLPVRDDVLAWYVTELLERGSASLPEQRRRPLAASSVERRLSAVATMAQEHGDPAPNQRAARKAIAGHRATRPARPRQAAAAGVEELRTLVCAARAQERPGGQSAQRLRARDACLLLVAWDLMLRRSELAGLCLGDVRWHPLGMEVAVRRAKTTSEEVWQPVRYRLDRELCAVRAVREWTEILAQDGHTASRAPLLCRLTRTDALPKHPKALSATAINNTIKDLADQAGLTKRDGGPATDAAVQAYTGHSLRRGPITAAARGGRSREQIGRRSGHVPGSPVLGRYIAEGNRWEEDPLEGLL